MLFDALGNGYVTLIVFLCSLGIGHVFVFARCTRKFWLVVDYVWLAVAVLSLVSATAQVRQLRATWEQNGLTQEIRTRKESAFHVAVAFDGLYRGGLPYETWKDQKLSSRFRMAANWFKDAARGHQFR
jgi:hypothetical protein